MQYIDSGFTMMYSTSSQSQTSFHGLLRLTAELTNHKRPLNEAGNALLLSDTHAHSAEE